MSGPTENNSTMESTKKLIRSILNSNPCNMNSRTLMKDYVGLMGKQIPYKTLGFQSLDDFLHAIPDVVQVQGSGPCAILNVVINDKVEHISALVTKQKLASKKRMTGFRRPVTTTSHKRELPPRMRYPQQEHREFIQKLCSAPCSTVASSNTPAPEKSCSESSKNSCEVDNNKQNPLSAEPIRFTINKKQLPLPNNAFCSENEPSDNFNTNRENNAISNFESNQYCDKIESFDLPNQNVYENPLENCISNNLLDNKDSNLSASQCQKIRLPSQQINFTSSKLNEKHPKLYTLKKSQKPVLSQQSLNLFTNAATSVNNNCVIEKPPILYRFLESLDQCHTAVNQSSPPAKQKPVAKEPKVPEFVRNNLKKLIVKYPDGIWCRNLPTTYQKMFRRPLLYLEYGYHNLIDMVSDLDSIFQWVQPESDDCMLFDCNQKVPEKYSKAVQEKGAAQYKPQSPQSINVILNKSNWSDFVWMFPDDIFPLGEQIEREFVREDIKENTVVDIMVGEVYDPSKFWVYMKEPHLDELMNEMQSFYRENAKKYLIPPHLLRNGLYCAQIIYDEYHRALVVDASPQIAGEVRLYYIDYGTVMRVPTDGICFLAKRFTKLKAQAIRARLADICPADESSFWLKDTTDYFRALIEGRSLSAKICHIYSQDQFLEILLADTTDDEAFYINDKLVEDGYAHFIGEEPPPRGQTSPNQALVKHLYLFPTFFEIEHGLAPCAAEMNYLYNLDIPLHLYIPQYFNNYSIEEAQHMKDLIKLHHKHKTKSRNEFKHDYKLDDYLHSKPDLELEIFRDVRSEIQVVLKKNEDRQAADAWREEEFEIDYEEAEEEEEIVTEWRNGPSIKSSTIQENYSEPMTNEKLNNLNQKSQNDITEIFEQIERLKNNLLTLSITSGSEGSQQDTQQFNDIPQQSSSRKVENYLREQRKFLTNPFLNPNFDNDIKNLENVPNPFLYENDDDENELDKTSKTGFNVNATPFEPKSVKSKSKSRVHPKWSDDLFGQNYEKSGSSLEQQNNSSEEMCRISCLNDDMNLKDMSISNESNQTSETERKEVEIQTEYMDEDKIVNKSQIDDKPLEITTLEPSASSSALIPPPTVGGGNYPMVGPPYPPPSWYNYNYSMNYNYWMHYHATMQSMMMIPPPPPPPPNMSLFRPPIMPPAMAKSNYTRPPPGFPVKITNLDSPTGSQ